jgi:hypothetical protein
VHLVQNPRGLPGGGVGEAVAERLRHGRLHRDVPAGLRSVPDHCRLVVGQFAKAGDRSRIGVPEVDVHAGDVSGVAVSCLECNGGAPVAALRAEALVAECQDRGDNGVGRRVRPPARHRRGGAEPEPRQGRDDHVEGIGRIAAVPRGVGEWPDHVVELHDRARPAVHEHQGSSVRMRGPRVDQVDRHTVDDDADVVERIQAVRDARHVVSVAPVIEDPAHDIDRDALAPVVDDLGLGQADPRQPQAQVCHLIGCERRDHGFRGPGLVLAQRVLRKLL